jgi:hypothetical protein
MSEPEIKATPPRPNYKVMIHQMRTGEIEGLREWLDLPRTIQDAIPVIRDYVEAVNPYRHWESRNELLEHLQGLGIHYKQEHDGKKLNLRKEEIRRQLSIPE